VSDARWGSLTLWSTPCAVFADAADARASTNPGDASPGRPAPLSSTTSSASRAMPGRSTCAMAQQDGTANPPECRSLESDDAISAAPA
jgi:hypothetical protein